MSTVRPENLPHSSAVSSAKSRINEARKRVRIACRALRPTQPEHHVLADAFRDLTIAGRSLGLYTTDESEEP